MIINIGTQYKTVNFWAKSTTNIFSRTLSYRLSVWLVDGWMEELANQSVSQII